MSNPDRRALTKPVHELAEILKGREVRLVRLDAGKAQSIVDLFKATKETITVGLEVSSPNGFDSGKGGDPATLVALAMIDTGPEGEA